MAERAILRVLAACASVVALLFAGVPAQAAPATVTNGTQFEDTGKCPDVASASTADGARVLQYTCGSGTNQQFGRPVA
ncbi:RICIN domain-containing protein [Streptomyces sp. NPDC102264]|uniref:RICIN domain-containing protein n=1 Tax=Streptomyces sp. NPDC102264 TaxID=3366149 RepID=UPI0038214542